MKNNEERYEAPIFELSDLKPVGGWNIRDRARTLYTRIKHALQRAKQPTLTALAYIWSVISLVLRLCWSIIWWVHKWVGWAILNPTKLGHAPGPKITWAKYKKPAKKSS